MPKTRNYGLLSKQMSTAAVSAFLQDLTRKVEDGLDDELCKRNKTWLNLAAAMTAAEVPDGGVFGKRLYRRWDDLSREYEKWNSPQGTAESRSKQLQRLKKKANKLARGFASRTQILEAQNNVNLYTAFRQGWADLIRGGPAFLISLGEVLSKFK
jgi:hypothetical protein